MGEHRSALAFVIETRQNRDGTWGLWVGRTCIRGDFITAEAAEKWAEQYLSHSKDGTSKEQTDAGRHSKILRQP